MTVEYMQWLLPLNLPSRMILHSALPEDEATPSLLVDGKMSRFPTLGKRRIAFGSRVHKSYLEKIYCSCKNRAMIACNKCTNWFHKDCMGLESKLYKDEEWVCQEGKSLLEFLKK